jgi:hypothetical protein
MRLLKYELKYSTEKQKQIAKKMLLIEKRLRYYTDRYRFFDMILYQLKQDLIKEVNNHPPIIRKWKKIKTANRKKLLKNWRFDNEI